MPYEVQTPVFEGPFDLLLHLILREQVDLYEVSLSTIVDGYLAELERMEQLDLEVASEFLLIAATLVELKSRRLLPVGDDLDLDEELALWEERDLLLHRLVECKTFKEAAIALAGAGRRGRPQPGPRGRGRRALRRPHARPARGVDADDLRRAYLRAMAPKPAPRSTSTTWRRSGPRSPTPSPSWSTSCPGSGASRSGRSPATWSSG